MQLDPHPPSFLGQLMRRPPPLWYVTNGDVTVGPVTTNLLVRGVLHERIPDDCMVRERAWSSFRELDRIREVAALKAALARNEAIEIERSKWQEPKPRPAHPELASFLEEMDDREAMFDRLLAESMKAAGALVGAVHRRMPPYTGFVTTSVAGPGMKNRADRAFAADEPTFLYAGEGRALCEATGSSRSSELVSERLGDLPACAGVVLLPIHCAGRLYATLELGRPDHPFRHADFKKVVELASLVVDRIETIRNPLVRADVSLAS